MRARSLLLAVLLAMTLLVPPTTADPECAEDEPDCTPSEGGHGHGRSENTTGNETDNETPTEGGNGKGATPKEDRRTAREEEFEARKAQARDQWREAMESQAERNRDAQREALLEQLPEHLRAHVGQLVPQDGTVQGTYLTFQPDAQLGVLQDVQHDGTLLFEEIYVPLALGASATGTTHGKVFQLRGDDWILRVSDDTSAPMYLRTTGDPFLLVLPAGATATPTSYGLEIAYVSTAGEPVVGSLRGDAQVDPEDPATLLVGSRASFHVSADRPLLPQVANAQRVALDEAISHGRLGAEATVLRVDAPTTFVDTVLYEDMIVDLQETTQEAGGFDGYTITVDSESHTGKTIAVSFESGLLDPERLAFRYFNVDLDRTVEATITEATSLQDVLDPLDDGTVAEYWIVQDADGTQVLVSIPHFSVHQIQLMSLVDVVLERPSLVLGTVGAVLLVAFATAGMFRRPDEE